MLNPLQSGATQAGWNFCGAQGRHLLANAAHPGRQVGGAERAPTRGRISGWLCTLRERSGWQIAAVALANKNARILWALMTKGEAFDANHLSVKPGMSPQSTT